METGIALDLGTSGFRAQCLDLREEEVVSTAITMGHPLPGANVMDHLHFAIECGKELAHHLILSAVYKLLRALEVDAKSIKRMAVCGNPIQLSLLQNEEIRDLAYSEDFVKRHGITALERDGKVLAAEKIGLKILNAELYVPPAVKHAIGADSLAMVVKSGFLNAKGPTLVTDYGTNAQMALKVKDEIITGSAAAGPAIEGQQIEQGMLAAPGAISDLRFDFGWRCYVLDDEMFSKPGDIVDLRNGHAKEKGLMHGKAKGVTGTGVVATVAIGLLSGLISLPRINSHTHKLHLQDGVTFTEDDLKEAGKAFGAIRAGHLTMAEHLGISLEELSSMYMAGASGTYVDPVKAQVVGMVPLTARTAYQVGNTSLALAGDLVKDPEILDYLQKLAEELRPKHVMFATSEVFKNVYVQELAYWNEGMPLSKYNELLGMLGIQRLSVKRSELEVKRIVERDIPVIGKKGLRILRDVGTTLLGKFDGCTGCKICVMKCPKRAIKIVEAGDRYHVTVESHVCNGFGCLKCVSVCPAKVFRFNELGIAC